MKTDVSSGCSPLRVLWVGVGGHGVVLGARVIAEVALAEGRYALMSEVHGMSQRGGVVETSVVIGPPASVAQGEDPLFWNPASPMIESRGARLLIATEPLEAIRAAPQFLHPDGTVVVFLAEAPPPGLFRGEPPYPSRDQVLGVLRSMGREVWTLEPARAQSDQAFRPNIALVGAAVRAKALPFTLAAVFEALPRLVPSRFVNGNIASLQYGFEAARCAWSRPSNGRMETDEGRHPRGSGPGSRAR